jgi:hypothetical protein
MALKIVKKSPAKLTVTKKAPLTPAQKIAYLKPKPGMCKAK